MLVSVIMPTYNCGKFILQSLDSVIAQTVTDWEVQIVDDCSTDNTAEVLKPYLEQYPNIHYYVLPQNGGPAVARTEAMRRATGKYIAFLDSDDLWMPDKLEKQIACMEQTGADIVIGSRFKTERKPINSRMIGSQLITTAIFLTTKGKYIGDVTSGMRLFNKKMIKRFGYDMHYSPEPDTLAYLLNCGVKIEEVQVQMHERIAGVSYLNFKSSIWYMMKMMFSIFLFQWVRKRGKES